MKQKKTTMVLLLGAMALLALGILAMFACLRGREDQTQTQGVSSYPVFSAEVSHVASLTVDNEAGERYQLNLDGSYVGTIAGVSDRVPLDTTLYSLLVGKYLNIKSYHAPIPVDTAGLATYGLAEPRGSVRVQMTDGTTHRFSIGSQTVKGNGYYLYSEGDSQAYIVENAYAEYLRYGRDDLISKQLASIDQSSGFTITQLSIRNTQRAYDAIQIQMRFGEYGDNSIYLYEVIAPEYYSADDYKINENVFAYLNPLKGTGVYSLDVSSENLEALGLAESQYTLSYINAGVESVFYFSVLEDGTVLAMAEEGAVILEMDPAILHMLNIGVSDVANAYVLLQSVAETERYTVRAEGKTYAFSLESQEGELSRVTYEGKSMDVELFRELFSRGLDMKIVGDATGDVDKTQCILALTYLGTDGRTNVLEYYDVDGRYCYVERNGSGRFLVRLSAVEAFLEHLHTITE